MNELQLWFRRRLSGDAVRNALLVGIYREHCLLAQALPALAGLWRIH